MSVKTLIAQSVVLPSVRGRAERGRLSAHRLRGAGRHGRWPDRAVLASLASEEAMTGTVLVVEERRGRCGAGGGLQKESRGESRRRGRRAPARSRGDRAERGIRSHEGEEVTNRWASLQVVASDLHNLMLAVVILQSSTFSGFLQAIVAIH